ncbi:MAG: hypothetical protein JSR80_00530 [Verrucomicrobia bacterium]|nr:hypothetical protein [Verrucomicrobiota bacterium]
MTDVTQVDATGQPRWIEAINNRTSSPINPNSLEQLHVKVFDHLKIHQSSLAESDKKKSDSQAPLEILEKIATAIGTKVNSENVKKLQKIEINPVMISLADVAQAKTSFEERYESYRKTSNLTEESENQLKELERSLHNTSQLRTTIDSAIQCKKFIDMYIDNISSAITQFNKKPSTDWEELIKDLKLQVENAKSIVFAPDNKIELLKQLKSYHSSCAAILKAGEPFNFILGGMLKQIVSSETTMDSIRQTIIDNCSNIKSNYKKIESAATQLENFENENKKVLEQKPKVEQLKSQYNEKKSLAQAALNLLKTKVKEAKETIEASLTPCLQARQKDYEAFFTQTTNMHRAGSRWSAFCGVSLFLLGAAALLRSGSLSQLLKKGATANKSLGNVIPKLNIHVERLANVMKRVETQLFYTSAAAPVALAFLAKAIVLKKEHNAATKAAEELYLYHQKDAIHNTGKAVEDTAVKDWAIQQKDTLAIPPLVQTKLERLLK